MSVPSARETLGRVFIAPNAVAPCGSVNTLASPERRGRWCVAARSDGSEKVVDGFGLSVSRPGRPRNPRNVPSPRFPVNDQMNVGIEGRESATFRKLNPCPHGESSLAPTSNEAIESLAKCCMESLLGRREEVSGLTVFGLASNDLLDAQEQSQVTRQFQRLDERCEDATEFSIVEARDELDGAFAKAA